MLLVGERRRVVREVSAPRTKGSTARCKFVIVSSVRSVRRSIDGGSAVMWLSSSRSDVIFVRV